MPKSGPVKPRRGGYHMPLQEIERAICPSVRRKNGSQTTKAVALNLGFYESTWPGPGYRPKKIENFLNPNFWRIFKVLNRARGLESSSTASFFLANSAVVVYMRALTQLLPNTSGFGMQLCFGVRIGRYWGVWCSILDELGVILGRFASGDFAKLHIYLIGRVCALYTVYRPDSDWRLCACIPSLSDVINHSV